MDKRLLGFFALMTVLFSGMIVRVFYLGTSPRLTETAKAQSSYSLPLSNARAEIYDRHFCSFVNQKKTYRAVVLPDMSCVDSLMQLNPSLDREEIAKKIQKGKPFIETVNGPATNNPYIQIYETTDRYAENSLAAHLIGYINREGNGVTGIEESYNDFLKENGQKLSVSCTINARGKYLKGNSIQLTSNGSSASGVVLTLDSGIQDIIEHVGKQTIPRGAIVVMDAQNAQIVGSASFPDFSQQNPAQSLNDTVNTPMVNRALLPFHVGSTFKIATAAAALDSGISENRTYNCTGQIEVAGQIFRCHKHEGHGVLNLQQALRDSCNPYFISLGLETGASKIRDVASDMGFGRSYTLADTIVSSKGYLPTLSELSNPGDVANFAFGQGELTGTPLQVSEMLFCVCNGGKTIAPTLVQGVTYNGSTIENQEKTPASMRCMSEKTAAILKKDLTLAVSEQSSDRLKPAKTTAGGKTATAQTGKKNKNGSDIYQVWYSGFFPADHPRYIVTVLLDGGSSGLESAEPIFAQIADLITEYQSS